MKGNGLNEGWLLVVAYLAFIAIVIVVKLLIIAFILWLLYTLVMWITAAPAVLLQLIS